MAVRNQMTGNNKQFINSRGVTVRDLIAVSKVGFQPHDREPERGPLYFQEMVRTYDAVPGGFLQTLQNNPAVYDYFDARGSLMFNAAKFIDFQFGYDKNFIGNGYRSLFLSDWGNSYLLKKSIPASGNSITRTCSWNSCRSFINRAGIPDRPEIRRHAPPEHECYQMAEYRPV